ncbi:helix-turn-helix domain-containing protein [Crossiella sp. NPDC003009]
MVRCCARKWRALSDVASRAVPAGSDQHRESLQSQDREARAIRFSTLTLLCKELRCQPGELLRYRDR